MSKFRVMIVKENGKPIGVRAAQVNGKTIIIALKNEQEQLTAYEAEKFDTLSFAEWHALFENLDAVNKALKKAKGEEIWKELSYYTNFYDYSFQIQWLLAHRDGLSRLRRVIKRY